MKILRGGSGQSIVRWEVMAVSLCLRANLRRPDNRVGFRASLLLGLVFIVWRWLLTNLTLSFGVVLLAHDLFESCVQFLEAILNVTKLISSYPLNPRGPFWRDPLRFPGSYNWGHSLHWVLVLLHLHWLECDVGEHLSIHSETLCLLNALALVWKQNSKGEESRSEVLRTDYHQVPAQPVENLILTTHHLVPAEISSTWDRSEVSDIWNFVVEFIVLTRHHQKGDSKEVFGPFNLLSFTKNQETVEIDNSDLQSDWSLLETVTNVEDPLNQRLS